TAHCLVGRMTDVRRRLNHTTAEAGEQRSQRLDGDNLARVVFIANRRGTFGAVDASHDRGECKRNNDWQVMQRLTECFKPLKPKCRKPLRWQQPFSRINRWRL